MLDGLTFISVVIGFGLVIVAGARFGAGSLSALGGLFATHGARDWPTGVQEGDAPRFVFARPAGGTTEASQAGGLPADDTSACEIDDLYAGPIRPQC
jgi:hypothetical protein